MSNRDRDAIWRDNMQNAKAALRMIREMIETLGPSGILPSKEAVIMLYGPEPVDEATALVEGIRRRLPSRDAARPPDRGRQHQDVTARLLLAPNLGEPCGAATRRAHLS